jgi:hypothetical protein
MIGFLAKHGKTFSEASSPRNLPSILDGSSLSIIALPIIRGRKKGSGDSVLAYDSPGPQIRRCSNAYLDLSDGTLPRRQLAIATEKPIQVKQKGR